MGDTAEISTPVRAIIADDHPLVLFAIENLMGGYARIAIRMGLTRGLGEASA